MDSVILLEEGRILCLLLLYVCAVNVQPSQTVMEENSPVPLMCSHPSRGLFLPPRAPSFLWTSPSHTPTHLKSGPPHLLASPGTLRGTGQPLVCPGKPCAVWRGLAPPASPLPSHFCSHLGLLASASPGLHTTRRLPGPGLGVLPSTEASHPSAHTVTASCYPLSLGGLPDPYPALCTLILLLGMKFHIVSISCGCRNKSPQTG